MDRMTQWATNPTVKKLVSQLGLPIKLPTLVRRDPEQDIKRPLLNKKVDTNSDAYTAALKAAGATLTHGDDADVVILHVTQAKALYGMLHPRRLKPHTHLILVAEQDHDAVTGFAKSYAREVGVKAITVNVIDKADPNTIIWLASDRSRYVTMQSWKLGKSGNGSFELDGQHAIVTGGARGIGAAICEVLARQGASVTVVDLPQAEDAAREVVRKIESAGGSAKFLGADVTKDEVVKEPASILINNAGITRDKTFAKMTQDKWDLVIAVNFEAAVRVTEEWLKKGNTGSAVFLSSVVGISGNFGQTNYTLSKAAVIGYVRDLKKKGVRANAIAPGFIDTVLTREVPFVNREMGKQLISLLQAGEPEDIAEMAAFLASSASSAIDGQTLRVDGGMFFGA